MTKLSVFALMVLLMSFTGIRQVQTLQNFADSSLPAWTKKVGALVFPASKKVYIVNDFGADPEAKIISTSFIQKAIDKAAREGGGQVIFKPGKYLTGSIFVRRNVHLKIDKGVEILGSENIADYPEIDTRVAGIEMKWPAALINVIGQGNVAITGEGIINARGKVFWDYYWNLRKEYEPKGLRWIVDYDAKRPRTLLVSASSNVTLKGLTLQQAGFWTVQLLYSKNISVNGLVIRNNVDGHGPSTDGIDVDSSSFILIENCDIDCNDDDFCLKAGRDWDGLRVNRPTEYVLIRKCVARSGAGLLTLGSETSGSIRHVIAMDLTGNGTSNGLNIKSATTRGGTIEDVQFRNIVLNNVGNVLQVTLNWNPSYSYSTLPAGYKEDSLPSHWKKMLQKVEPASKGIPSCRNISLINVKATNAKRAINASGLKESLLQQFNFINVDITAATAGSIDFASGWSMSKFLLKTTDSSKIELKNTAGINLPASDLK